MTHLITNTLSLLTNAQRIIVKVGSSLVTNDGQGLDYVALENWAIQITALRQQNKQVILVSSGAIAQGMQRLGWLKRPTHIAELQAAAAVGQVGLVHAYETIFAKQGIATAQILLTHADLADRERYLNARSTLLKLLELGVVPIINENDTVVTDEIKVGDNDTLGALVANLIDADVLVILTDQPGLYSADPRKDPHAKFIQHATAGDVALEGMAGGAGSNLGKGGMITKILAAKRAAYSGAHTIIASGREPNILPRLAAGEKLGTHLESVGDILSARKQWLADHLQLRGSVILDTGACQALTVDRKSLLPIGVIRVEGDFSRGEVVACVNELGVSIARGIVNYSAAEVRLIMRKTSTDIVTILGYVAEPEVIHCDNMMSI
jgi:glutamate 5-kinase